jgi:hypothetical protein
MTKDDILSMAKQSGADTLRYWDTLKLERFAALVAEKEREAIRDEWQSCVMSDLENGVKCLNEKAAQDWHKNYPAQAKMFPEWLDARGESK